MKTAYRKAARQKRQQREQFVEGSGLRRQGRTFDVYQGRERQWYQNCGDVKRWEDNDQPVERVNL